jgi:transcriptional regulator with XRE-family HTH domain
MMTSQDLIRIRERMGWSRAELARQLEISSSRVVDYEIGHTRGQNAQPAPIPKLVELACRYLAGDRAPMSDEEWIAGLKDLSRFAERRRKAGLPPLDDAAISRDSIYDHLG